MILAGAALIAFPVMRGDAQTLLSYWNFNNDASVFNASNNSFGALKTTDSGFGEVYNATSARLSSNSANGVVYPSGYIDFSGMAGTANSGNTSTTGWGVFKDASQNLGAGQGTGLRSGDASTQQGGLVMVLSNTSSSSSLVFSLDTAGYQGISLSYAGRLGGTSPTLAWSYSYDDAGWTSLTPTQTGTITNGGGYFNVSQSLGSLFDNQGQIYLKLTASETSSTFVGSFAMDNIQVLAASAVAVPEPPVVLLLGCAGVLLAFLRRRSPRPLPVRS